MGRVRVEERWDGVGWSCDAVFMRIFRFSCGGGGVAVAVGLGLEIGGGVAEVVP
jgi:hypothetical protein